MITAPQILTTSAQAAATIHLVIPRQDMGRYMDPAIQEVIAAITAQGLAITGPMFSYHHRRPSDTFDFEIGFPVAQAVQEQGRVKSSSLPAAKVVRAVYQGPYEHLGEAWRALEHRVKEHGITTTGRFWESYLNNPDEVQDPGGYLTELNWMIE